MEKNYDKQTGEIKSSVRCYHSLDFDSAKKRLKEDLNNWKNGPYIVHVEDYESINDMVRRCVKTKTKFPIEQNNPLAHYDSDEEIAQQLPEYIDRTAKPESVSEQEQAKDEQSEVEASSTSDSSGSEPLLS